MSKYNSVIIVPFYHNIHPETDHSLRQLEWWGYDVWRITGFSAIDQGRCRLAYKALYEDGYDRLMWVDADLGFDPNDVNLLHEHDLSIVAGLYPVKGHPRMASSFEHPGPVAMGKAGGLVPLRYAAGGFTLIQKHVYDVVQVVCKLPFCCMWGNSPIYPWHMPMLIRDEGDLHYMGEDYAFCERARQCGFSIMGDTRIRLKHIGQYGYEWEDIKWPGKANCSTVVIQHPEEFQGGSAECHAGKPAQEVEDKKYGYVQPGYSTEEDALAADADIRRGENGGAPDDETGYPKEGEVNQGQDPASWFGSVRRLVRSIARIFRN